MKQDSSYYDIVRRSEIKEENRRLRRLFLRYKEAGRTKSMCADGILSCLVQMVSETMLSETDREIRQIGETLGFSSAPHFTKIFRQFTDMTPSEYRRESKRQIWR